MATKAIPEGYHSVTPHLIINGAAGAIDFYKQAFGATELMRMQRPDGKMVMQRARSAIPQSCWRTSIRRWISQPAIFGRSGREPDGVCRTGR